MEGCFWVPRCPGDPQSPGSTSTACCGGHTEHWCHFQTNPDPKPHRQTRVSHDSHGHRCGQSPSPPAAPGGQHVERANAGLALPTLSTQTGCSSKGGEKLKQQLSEIMEMPLRSQAFHPAGVTARPWQRRLRIQDGSWLSVIPEAAPGTKPCLHNTGPGSAFELVSSINCSCLDMKYRSELLLLQFTPASTVTRKIT